MALGRAVLSGITAATAVTLIHETTRRKLRLAPRADILGVRLVENVMLAANQQPPTGDRLHRLALAADLVSNSAYYSLIGLGRRRGAGWRGLALGALAGLGGIVLPGPLGLGESPTVRSPETKAMTVAWYLLGGLVSGLVYRALTAPRRDPERAGMMR